MSETYESSILDGTKKALGIDPDYDVFDPDIMIHLNASLFILTQLGIGPENGFSVSDNTATWSDFVSETQYEAVKQYVYLRTRLAFDPPNTSFVIDSIEKQLRELEWRLNVRREETQWTQPTSSYYGTTEVTQ